MFIIEHKKEFEYPKDPGTLGPPNHIDYYNLRFGGLDFHLGDLNLFVYN